MKKVNKNFSRKVLTSTKACDIVVVYSRNVIGGDVLNAFVGRTEMARRLVELRGDMSSQVAARGIGITQSALSNYEAGIRVPRDEVKALIANFYKTTVAEIFFLPRPLTKCEQDNK